MVKALFSFSLAAGLIAFFASVSPIGSGLKAQSLEEELNKRISAEEKELERLKNQIEKKRKAIEAAGKDEEAASSVLEALKEKIGLLREEQALLNLELKRSQKQKAKLDEKAGETEKRLKLDEAALAKRLRAFYKAGNFSYLKAIFSSEDFADFLRLSRYALIISRLDADMLKERSSQLNELRVKRSQIEESQKEIKAKEQGAAEKAMEISGVKAETDKLIAQLKKKRESHEKELSMLEEASARLPSLIGELLEKRKAISSDRLAKRTEPPNAWENIAEKRGKLPWPTRGKVLTQFGKVKDRRFKTYIFSKGINIQAPFGSEVKPIGAGVVLFSDTFRGYGKLLIVDHGEGYYSLYGNVSEILVAVGEEVGVNRTVAKVGRNNDLGTPSLYFEIRNHGKAEDPLEWLDKGG